MAVIHTSDNRFHSSVHASPAHLHAQDLLHKTLAAVPERPDSLRNALVPASYPKGAWLCSEGASATGVFLLRAGRVKESLCSSEGKRIIVRIAGPGQIIGLTAVMSGPNYDITAEALEPTEVDFVAREDFVRALGSSEELGLSVVHQLGQNCADAYQNLRRLGFALSVSQRLASLVLYWLDHSVLRKTNLGLQFDMTLTQEEIAQLLGTTRETVSRALASLRKRGWLRTEGASWTVPNKPALRRLASRTQM